MFGIFIAISAFADEPNLPSEKDPLENSLNEDSSKNVKIDPITGFPMIEKKPFVMFDYGASLGLVSRIEIQKNRSNFVRQTHLLGTYVAMQTANMKPVNSMIRLAGYYPIHNTFNGMKQKSKQLVLGAFDLFAGPILEVDMWKYVFLKGAGGLHFMYQATDQYHLLYLGLGILVGAELPVANRWTVLINGMISADYPNFGTNRQIQPYSVSWNYQVDLGVRYSIKGIHEYSYINIKSAKKKKNSKVKTESESKTSE